VLNLPILPITIGTGELFSQFQYVKVRLAILAFSGCKYIYFFCSSKKIYLKKHI